MKSKQQQAKDNYLNEKVETFVVRVAKGKKELIEQRAKELSLTRNSYINNLIDNDMKKDV